MDTGRFVRIEFPKHGKSGPSKTQGTEVYCGDAKLGGVTKIELVAETNDVWRAVIHCHVIVKGDVSAIADIIPIK